MPVVCVDSGCVGGRRWGDVHFMAEEVVPSTLSLAAPFCLPVRGLLSRGPGWLATALCARVLPNDADTAHGVQVFPTCTVLQH